MRSSRLLVVLGVLVAGLLVANQLVKSPTVYDVRIVAPPAIIASLPHWVAEETGLYAQRGLRVSTIQLTGSDLMIQALVNGDADVLPAVSLVDVVNAAAKTTRAPLIYSHSRMRAEPPFESIVAIRGSTIATLKDLQGQSIAVYPGPTATAAVREFLRRNNVDPTTVKFIPLPPPEHIMALQRGDVAASHIYEPTRTQILQAGRTREIAGSVYAFFQEGSAVGVSVLSSRFRAENRAASDRFLEAWDAAIDYIRNEPVGARKILAARLKLPSDVAAGATWVDATKTDELEPDAVVQTARFFQDIQMIGKDAAIDDRLFLERDR